MGISDSSYDDLGLTIEKYRRYTMQDINNLNEKLEDLKENVSLNALELATDTLSIFDSSGLQRTKSGILADNFKDNAFKDIFDLNNRSTIFVATKTMGPETVQTDVDMLYDSDKSTNVIKKGDNIYLTHTDQLAIKQTLISGTENVNPFAVVSGEGRLTLSPASDWWLNTKYAADNIINKTVETDLADAFTGTHDVSNMPRPQPAPLAFNPIVQQFRGGRGRLNAFLNAGGDLGILDNTANLQEPGMMGGGGVGGGFADATNWGWFGINIRGRA